MGDKPGSPVNLVVSTVIEAEKLVPLLKEYQHAGRAVNVSLIYTRNRGRVLIFSTRCYTPSPSTPAPSHA